MHQIAVHVAKVFVSIAGHLHRNLRIMSLFIELSVRSAPFPKRYRACGVRQQTFETANESRMQSTASLSQEVSGRVSLERSTLSFPEPITFVVQRNYTNTDYI